MVRLVMLSAVATIAIAATAAAAPTTPPGKNGRIAFTRYLAGERDGGAIFTIDSSGRGARQVTRPPVGSNDVQPDWSPDGFRILFERQYPDRPREVFSVRPDGSDLRQIDPGCPPGIPERQICEEESPAWSPDGKRIAFGNAYGRMRTIGGTEAIEVFAIAVMDADGSNRRQLTQLERPTSAEDRQPVYSPDGTRIAFQRENSTASPRGRTAIFVVNAKGGGVRRLTPWRLDAGDHPDWSPDGSQILFRSSSFEFAGSNLYLVRPNGKGLKQLTHFPASVDVLSASYSPDANSIVFSRSGKAGRPDLFVMRSDGTSIRQLARTSRWESAPDWGPGH